MPVVFHNLSGYDSYLFIMKIATRFGGRVSLIPQTEEKYIFFTKYVEGTEIQLRFLDSLRFMASSLEIGLLPRQPEDRRTRIQKKLHYGADRVLKTKGVFPYDCLLPEEIGRGRTANQGGF